MPETIIHADESGEYWSHEGCHILELVNQDSDPAVSIARARVTPDTQTCWHYLEGVTERYLIAQGRGSVEVGESLVAQVKAGDIVLIPAGIRQRIRNTGSDDLVFYAICSPRFTASCYRSVRED